MDTEALTPRSAVMLALVASIHVLMTLTKKKDVDGRDKPGHDAEYVEKPTAIFTFNGSRSSW
jgi:hypothetical protein